jgi:regulatory protein
MGEFEQQDTLKPVWDRAVKLLSIRMHTRSELKRKLAAKRSDAKIIEDVLNKLERLKLINDAQFAEIFLDNLIRHKTHGFYVLKMKLLQRGVDAAIVQELLAERLDIETEQKIAQKFVGKTHKEKDKLAQRLSRKGFRNEVIAKVLANMV